MSIQDKFNRANVIYKITKDIDLGGETLTIPEGCTLDFQGGSFSNGTIVGSNTNIQAGLVKIFNKIKNNGGFICNAVYPQWFGAVANGINYCADEIQEAIDFAINGNIVSNPWDIAQVKGHSLKVILPAGSYIINKSIYLTNYSHIEGEDRGVTKIVNALLDEGEAIFYCGTYDSQSNIKTSINNASIRNLSINGQDKNCIGIFSTAHYTYFENLFIQSCGLHGIYCWEMWSSYIHRCHFIYNSINESGCTIYMDGHSMGLGANAVNITDCEFLGYDSKFTDGTGETNLKCQCFYINNGFGAKITNCSFQQFKTLFEVTPSAQSVTVENCYFEDNYYIFIGALYGVNILNNFFTAPLLSNAIISADVIRGCNIMNNLIGHYSVKIAKPYTENSESYLYYNNRIAGNFCSGHDANVDETILAKFDSKQNYLLTSEGNAYGSAKGTEDKYIRESSIFQTLGSFLKSIIWNGYAVMTVYCNKNNGVTDAPTEGWLDVTAFRISTSGALVICKSRGVTHSEVWIGKYEEGVISSWVALNTSPKGNSTLRPVLNSEKASYQYFDTTLNKPIWWTGTKWVDATGAEV